MENTFIIKGSARFEKAYDTPEQVQVWFSTCGVPGLAMVGRSNVGKSTLINSLFGNKTAKTSKTPGRTQKINVFSFMIKDGEEQKKFFLYDLPGYGFAKVSRNMTKSWGELMEAFFIHMHDNTLICNIQDSRHPNQKTDQSFYQYINPKRTDIFLIFNKIDKLKTQKERSALNKLKPQIYKEFKSVKQIHFVSAEKNTACEELEYALGSYLLSKLED